MKIRMTIAIECEVGGVDIENMTSELEIALMELEVTPILDKVYLVEWKEVQ